MEKTYFSLHWNFQNIFEGFNVKVIYITVVYLEKITTTYFLTFLYNICIDTCKFLFICCFIKTLFKGKYANLSGST